MAKKGQKFNNHSNELRNQVVEDYIKGRGSYASLARKYSISCGTISTWVYNFRQRGHSIKCKRGRPKETEINYKERYEILKKFLAFLKEQQEKR